MPVLHKYKEKDAHFVLTSIDQKVVTFHLSLEAERRLKSAGIKEGQTFERALLLDLCRSGNAFTYGTGPGRGMPKVDLRQMEFDFSNDPTPESMFPSCAVCSSLGDLHLVEEIKGQEHCAAILCPDCRRKKASTLDTSIPLPFVSRGVLNRFLAFKNIDKIDRSVSNYQDLLNAEFQAKWDALALGKRKPPKQEKLKFDKSDEKQKTLIK
jgi:hypothetical protein